MPPPILVHSPSCDEGTRYSKGKATSSHRAICVIPSHHNMTTITPLSTGDPPLPPLPPLTKEYNNTFTHNNKDISNNCYTGLFPSRPAPPPPSTEALMAAYTPSLTTYNTRYYDNNSTHYTIRNDSHEHSNTSSLHHLNESNTTSNDSVIQSRQYLNSVNNNIDTTQLGAQLSTSSVHINGLLSLRHCPTPTLEINKSFTVIIWDGRHSFGQSTRIVVYYRYQHLSYLLEMAARELGCMPAPKWLYTVNGRHVSTIRQLCPLNDYLILPNGCRYREDTVPLLLLQKLAQGCDVSGD